MLTSPIEIVAEHVARVCLDRGAVRDRESGNVKSFVTVEDLAFECDFDRISDWPSLKRWMIDHGYPIAYLPGKGHYLGESGEEIVTIYYQMRTSLAHSRRLSGLQAAIARCRDQGNAGWKFLSKTYGANSLSDLELEKVRRIKPEGTDKPEFAQ